MFRFSSGNKHTSNTIFLDLYMFWFPYNKSCTIVNLINGIFLPIVCEQSSSGTVQFYNIYTENAAPFPFCSSSQIQNRLNCERYDTIRCIALNYLQLVLSSLSLCSADRFHESKSRSLNSSNISILLLHELLVSLLKFLNSSLEVLLSLLQLLLLSLNS